MKMNPEWVALNVAGIWFVTAALTLGVARWIALLLGTISLIGALATALKK